MNYLLKSLSQLFEKAFVEKNSSPDSKKRKNERDNLTF